MNILGVLFEQQKSTNKFVSEILSFDFHVVDSVVHEFKSDITSNPVEDGIDVTDNIRIMPYMVTMSGMVSNNHIDTSLSNQFRNFIDGATYGKTPNDYFDILVMIFESKKEITVYTKEKTYSNMAIESINVPRDATTGEALNFTISFKQIRKVSTQSVAVPAGISRKLDKKAGDGMTKKAESTKAGGAKQPVTPTTEKSKSVLSGIFESLKK